MTAATKPSVLVNLSVPARAAEARALGAAGVGLMRAEFLVYQTGRHPLFLITDPPPNDLTTVLADGMRTVAREFRSLPVLYRTMDMHSNDLLNLVGGSDFEEHEDNPALGCRGVNRSIRDPDTFDAELAAVGRVRAEGHANINLMLPFVRWPEEVVWARERMERAGLDDTKLWMMVETPAAILRAEEFSALVDGVSIGSNDLTQLLLGVDRDNVAFARQNWDLDPTVQRGLQFAVDEYRKRGVPVGICGDAPSRSPELLGLLLDWGLDSISVSLDRVSALHELIASTPSGGVAAATDQATLTRDR
jgi:pyruvate,water dikinase